MADMTQRTVDSSNGSPAPVEAAQAGASLLESFDGGVLRLHLNRPDSLNALNRSMGEGLRAGIARAAADDAVRCVVLSGSGRAFCSGWDVASPGPDDEGVLDDLLHPLVREIRALPKPVVSSVQGVAAGYGCALAIAADLVVASRSSSFLLAFARIGLSGDGGVTATLPARVGLGRATRMMMLAERVHGHEALDIGLVDYLAEDADLGTAVAELAGRLASGPTRSYRATKDLLATFALARLDEQLDRERDHADELTTSTDYSEGLNAFAERRPTHFTGH